MIKDYRLFTDATVEEASEVLKERRFVINRDSPKIEFYKRARMVLHLLDAEGDEAKGYEEAFSRHPCYISDARAVIIGEPANSLPPDCKFPESVKESMITRFSAAYAVELANIRAELRNRNFRTHLFSLERISDSDRGRPILKTIF